ncbi:hypothetical protein KY320_00830 [Candidatus Woesearchaeota archaeon]|nr:hypothetical protein [Candidatus Woesearchaeota archaeon]
MTDLLTDFKEREITHQMHSQKAIRESLAKSIKTRSQTILQTLQTSVVANQRELSALLHTHFAAIQYLLGHEPTAYDLPLYKQLFQKAGIQNVLEIGGELDPLANPLLELLGEAAASVKLTHIGPLLWKKGFFNQTHIPGYFPEDMPEGLEYDLVIACGVFEVGAQGVNYPGSIQATEDLRSIAEVLSPGRSVGINICQQKAAIVFDEKTLREENRLLYVNDIVIAYLPALFRERLVSDIVVVKKPLTVPPDYQGEQ